MYQVISVDIQGVWAYEAKRLIETDALRPQSKVRLIKEPTNPYDKNAIMVTTLSGSKIGYIPRQIAAIISNATPTNFTMECDIARAKNHAKNTTVAIFLTDLWGIASSSKKVAFDLNKFDGISGVYEIRNVVNDKFYIGSSKNIKHRFQQHIRELNNGSHYNIDLQQDWRQYTEKNFTFKIVLKCPEDKLLQNEASVISSTYACRFGYNQELDPSNPQRYRKKNEAPTPSLRNEKPLRKIENKSLLQRLFDFMFG